MYGQRRIRLSREAINKMYLMDDTIVYSHDNGVFIHKGDRWTTLMSY